jgi:hypothetical protein
MKITCYSCQNFEKITFLYRFFKETQILNLIKIRSMAAELFYADGRADRRGDMPQQRVTFRNSANAPKNEEKIHFWWAN